MGKVHMLLPVNNVAGRPAVPQGERGGKGGGEGGDRAADSSAAAVLCSICHADITARPSLAALGRFLCVDCPSMTLCGDCEPHHDAAHVRVKYAVRCAATTES